MQEHKRLEYLCLACGWRKSIPMAWADSKPRKCPNQKCKTNFQVKPDKLTSYDPENKPGQVGIEESEVQQEVKYKSKKKS